MKECLDPIEADERVRPTLDNLRVLAQVAKAYRQVDHVLAHSNDAAHLFKWGELVAYEQIGEGSFGEVYRAYDRSLSRRVALKLLKSSRLGRSRQFIDEARKLAQVRHPNVLAVYGVDTHDQRVGLWAEFLEGMTLDRWLQEHGPFSPQEAAVVGMHLCRALAAIHRKGLIYCDLKPANIMREEGGRIVLMDFGAVRSLAPDGSAGGIPVGTPLTMAPEVLLGSRPTAKSDMYSLGVVLYWMVTGEYPVDAEKVHDLIQKHRRNERKLLLESRPELPRAFIDVVQRAIDPNPTTRIRNPAELENELAQFLAGTREPTRKRTNRFAAFAMVAALAVVFLGWGLWKRSPVSDPFVVEAGLFCARGGDSVPLSDLGAIRLGDELHLEWRASETANVYVFNEDESGAFHVLFPLGETDTKNPLAAGQWYQLPGSVNGVPMDWQVTSLGGVEHFLVVSAVNNIAELDALIEVAPQASPQAEVPLAMTSTRGVGGLTESQQRDSRPQSMEALKLLVERLQREGSQIRTQEYRLTSQFD